MWRMFFLAIGVFVCVLGLQCLAVEKFVLKNRSTVRGPDGQVKVVSEREVATPDWAPWSLLSTGAVVALYSFTLPKRMGK